MHPKFEEKTHHPHRCYLAELLGTFILTFADAGVSIARHLNADIGNVSLSLVSGLVVFALIFALGELSGAHINPAVTFSFTLRGVFPWKKVPGYLGMQILGALLAAQVLKFIFGDLGNLGVSEFKYSPAGSFWLETILSFFLVFVILSTSHQHKIKGPKAAYPVGAIIIVCGLIGKMLSGASMNPARSLGPAIVSGHLDQVWVYVTAPFLGGLIAVMLVYLTHGKPKSKDEEAAVGEKNADPSQGLHA